MSEEVLAQAVKSLSEITKDHEKRIRLIERSLIVILTAVAVVKFFLFK